MGEGGLIYHLPILGAMWTFLTFFDMDFALAQRL
jgi:hypothetical protein